jgi:hypothetical protein
MLDRMQGPFSVYRSQEDALFDRLTTFVSTTAISIVHVEMLIREGITRC